MSGLINLTLNKSLVVALICLLAVGLPLEGALAQAKKTGSSKTRSTYSSSKKKTKKKTSKGKKKTSRKKKAVRKKARKRAAPKNAKARKKAPPAKAAPKKAAVDSETKNKDGTAKTEEAPPDQVTSGKSVDLSDAFVEEEQKSYSYEPVDPIFWAKIQSQLADNNQVAAVIEAAKQEDTMGTSTAEGGEAQLAMSIGLMQKRLYFAAFYLLTNLVQDRMGTNVGEGALYHLSKLTQESEYDQHALTQLLSRNEFNSLHPEVESFVSYHKGMELLQLGFKAWSDVHMNRIQKDSYWDYLFRYWTAIGEVARDRSGNAIKIFQKLLEVQELPASIFEKTAIQYARLVFEQGDFNTASAIYDTLGVKAVREIGRLNLERAWVLYYQKDYSQAMGVLTSLQSPYFEPSITFERHILEMIIYRELCHYKAVEAVAQRFRFNFNKSLKAIRKRVPLRHDKMLFNMAVLDMDVQGLANLIDQMRGEMQTLAEYNWGAFSFHQVILEEYQRMDKILQSRIDLELEEKARYAANELLDAEEQVLFLEYTSRLDELRIRRGDDRIYKAEDISYVTFEKIYWPVDGEFWWDEMPDYKMLISSRCGDMTSPDDDKLERDFR